MSKEMEVGVTHLSQVRAWATGFRDRIHAERGRRKDAPALVDGGHARDVQLQPAPLCVRPPSRPGIGWTHMLPHGSSPAMKCSRLQLSSLVGAAGAVLVVGFSAHAEYQSLLLGDYD